MYGRNQHLLTTKVPRVSGQRFFWGLNLNAMAFICWISKRHVIHVPEVISSCHLWLSYKQRRSKDLFSLFFILLSPNLIYIAHLNYLVLELYEYFKNTNIPHQREVRAIVLCLIWNWTCIEFNYKFKLNK